MIDFDAKEIANWADMPDAFHQFPRMISKLILATAPATSFIDMPSGSSVWLPDWDGLLEFNGGNAWVPSGKSSWEFSVGKKPRQQAAKNYTKRTPKSLGDDAHPATFIFATPRVWKDKRKWLMERRKEEKWADVRAYDASDLVNWLGQAPGVADWFARVIRKMPDAGFTCLDYWWENWTSSTQPQITPELVLAGRSEQTKTVADCLSDSSSSFYVQADTRDEAIAFVTASALVANDAYGESLLSRAVVVETSEAWRSLVYSDFPMVLIRNFEGDVSAQIAVKNGHHVLVPIHSVQEPRGKGFRLPMIGRDETIDALKSMGMTEHRARTLSRKAARRLPVMRRRLLEEAGAPTPPWVSGTSLQTLTALVPLGQWSEDKKGDKEAVARLAGKPYEEVERELTPLLNTADSPLTKIGQRWRYVSHEEAWHILAPYLTSSDASNFQELAVETFSQESPKFDLPVEERFMAPIKGKVLPHSETLIEGIARGLALMGTQPERIQNVQDAPYIPWRVVHRVLGASSNWRIWGTLDRHLATLAEAAPDAFLDAVERALEDEPSPLPELFTQDEDPGFGGTPQAGLLSGLECLAWSKDYFPRVVIALAKLSEIDPGGQSANRPAESIRHLFHWMFRFTEASDEERIEVLTTLLKRHPEIGWDVLTGNLPRDVAPRRNLLDSTEWRQWGQDGYSRASGDEIMEFRHNLSRLALEYTTSDVGQWKKLLRTLSAIEEVTRRELLRKLERTADEVELGMEAETLRTEIRAELNRHRSYPDAWWAMPPEDVKTLNTIYYKLTPADPVTANAWVFKSDWPDLPEGKQGEADEQRGQIDAAQREALLAIFEAGGVDALGRLLEVVKFPNVVGTKVAAYIDTDEVFPLALDCLKSEIPNRKDFAINYFSTLCHESGWAVLDQALDAIKAVEEIKPEALASVYISATSVDFKTCLQRLDTESQSVQDPYWNNINWFEFKGSEIETQDRLVAIQRLLAARRSLAVAQLIWPREVPLDLVALTLEQIPKDLANRFETMNGGLGYKIAQLFKRLDESEYVSDEMIANLELPYIGMLDYHRPTLTLHREVMRQPSLFADLIALYASVRPDGQLYDETLDEETRKAQFEFSYNVLSKLRGLPGAIEDGTIDAEALETWVYGARRLCTERDRAEIGDEKIGKILANAPVGKDGAWPCEPVRDLLDKLASPEHIGNGFTTGRFNQRGMTTRGMYDGGMQECELAELYRKDAARIASKWPFTAKLLHQMAQDYEADARGEDTRTAWMDATYG